MHDLEKDEIIRLGYIYPKKINGLWCAIRFQIFTVALCYGLDKYGIEGRYCFHTLTEAVEAIGEWSGIGDPIGNWVKLKSKGGERTNPNYLDINHM